MTTRAGTSDSPQAPPSGALTLANAARAFEEAASAQVAPPPPLSGRGIVISAGGPFVPGGYVVVRLLRHFGCALPVQIWHAGPDEIPAWARRAFEEAGATLHDIMEFTPERPLAQMRGWPIKPAAIKHCSFREVLFLDADAFPVRNPEFLLDSAQFREHRALFWPDYRHHKLVSGGRVWELTGLEFRNDPELETGVMAVDKVDRWRELSLAEWMNRHSAFWYQHVLGDKDTYYLAWRKLGRPYFLGPPCRRHTAVIARHFWADGTPLVDHRTGTSKYRLPVRRGPFVSHLAPYKYRPAWKNVFDELMQRFYVRDFKLHVAFLAELGRMHDASRGDAEPPRRG